MKNYTFILLSILIASCAKQNDEPDCDIDGSWSKVDTVDTDFPGDVTVFEIRESHLSMQDGFGSLERSMRLVTINADALTEVLTSRIEEELTYIPIDSFGFIRKATSFLGINGDGFFPDTTITEQEGQYIFRRLECDRIALPKLIHYFNGEVEVDGEEVLERD